MERLEAAAIIRDGQTVSRFFKSHIQVRASMGDADPEKSKRGDTEGFITSNGRFVDRQEAIKVGLASGQLNAMWDRPNMRDVLSSDINW